MTRRSNGVRSNGVRSNGVRSTAVVPSSLGRLRLRLTAWYVGTFFVILTLLGVAMFATITRRFDHELDESLRDATRALARVARARAVAPHDGTHQLFDSATDLRIPDRTLYLLDTSGQPLAGDAPPDWIRHLAMDAARVRTKATTHAAPHDGTLRSYAQRVALSDTQAVVAVAVASEIELEDRYSALIAAFGAAAIGALLLVAAGGWMLARQSTAPVERAMVQMRHFMADAAHELRTPLAVVRSRSEVALQRPRSQEEYLAALRSIERESERLGRIVEDLLTLSRADAGERAVARQRVFFDDVTLDAADAVRIIAERKSVRLEVGDFEEAAVDGDPALLRQLVIILLDNAIKFTPGGGFVRIGVRASATVAELTVSDTGIGIGPGEVPFVFDRFYRADTSRTRSSPDASAASEGVGLGLAIARWIVDEHGGIIAIESNIGRGTRVTVQFPRAAAASVSSS
jgi:signal transduction histidine kinase